MHQYSFLMDSIILPVLLRLALTPLQQDTFRLAT
jgi:hypothetical protein